MKNKPIQWRIEYFLFRSFACVVELLNPRQAKRVSEALAWLFVSVLPRKLARYDVAKDNLQQAFGSELSEQEIHETIRKMWVHLFRLVIEIIQFPRKFHHEGFRQVMRFQDRSQNVEALTSGRTVLMVGGHYGNWEATTVTFGFFGYRSGIVARKLDNPFLDRWFREAREATGHQVLLKDGGWNEMVHIFESGGNMALLCDQDAGKRGIFVDFFGRPASTYRSIALMALEQKAIIIVGYGIRVEDDFENARWSRFEVGTTAIIDVKNLESEDEVKEITERYSQALEQAIRRAPEQYFWIHRRWKTPPRASRSQAARKAG